MTKTTKYILNHWNWNAEEINLLNTIGYEGIDKKICALDDATFDKLCDYFTGWLLGENSKARLNYWMKKTGINEAMLNIWHTV